MKQSAATGFTVVEMLMVVAIMGVLATIAIPLTTSAMKNYRLDAAVDSVTGAIQSTRYQAITAGCPYTIAFSQLTRSYQVANEPLSGSPPACAASFSNLGSVVPWSSSGDLSLTAAVTLQFSPNGIVTVASGSLPMTLSNGIATKQIMVSGVGNVTVTP